MGSNVPIHQPNGFVAVDETNGVYQLVDFGNGRKLERFGEILVDRPSPVATGRPRRPEWTPVDARFDIVKNHRGNWTYSNGPPRDWVLKTTFGEMQLFPTGFGHVGVFAEQQSNWNWIHRLKNNCLNGLKLLNLFAYTGGSTLAAAAAGAEVVHVDSAKNMVNRARSNARISQLEHLPVRWIVEDAFKFVQRESRRGNRYDGVIMDPPTYGHGITSGTSWKIEENLGELLSALGNIIPECRLMLFTCHSSGFTPRHMLKLAADAFGPVKTAESGQMNLMTNDGRSLPSGNFVRWFSR